MSTKKIESALSLIEVAEKNLSTAKSMLNEVYAQKAATSVANSSDSEPATPRSNEEAQALEVVEGYFDGENMIGDNGQIYPVPQNYASKTQLVIGDRMKWIMTPQREVFKLIQPTTRQRVTGTFSIEGDNYLVLVDGISNPIKILKASATYAMKNLGLEVGDEVAIYIPQDTTPVWGAFISVVKPNSEEKKAPTGSQTPTQDSQASEDVNLTPEQKDQIAQDVADFF